MKLFLQSRYCCNSSLICHEWCSHSSKCPGPDLYAASLSLSVATLHEICLRLRFYLEQLQPGDVVLSCFSDLIHTEWIRCHCKSYAKIRGLLTSVQTPASQVRRRKGWRWSGRREGRRESEKRERERVLWWEGGNDEWDKKSHWFVAQRQNEIYSICLIKLAWALTDYIMTGNVWLGSQKPDHWAPLHLSIHTLTSSYIHCTGAAAQIAHVWYGKRT